MAFVANFEQTHQDGKQLDANRPITLNQNQIKVFDSTDGATTSPALLTVSLSPQYPGLMTTVQLTQTLAQVITAMA